MLIDIIAGARPNFMKVAPIIKELELLEPSVNAPEYRLIHTGQHYDQLMSGSFFEQLEIPSPDINLKSGSGTQAEQTASIMTKYEQVLLDKPCDISLVVGDVNSTLACSIAAKKLGIKVGHVEAGIRSGDLGMPEEINRMVTDSISDYFYTTSRSAGENLLKLGISREKILFVGNTMIDTLLSNMKKLRKPDFWEDYELQKGNYMVLTLHRPANVDEFEKLFGFLNHISDHSGDKKVVFPVHPRTSKQLDEMNVLPSNLVLVDPLGYLEFNFLVKNALAVITDSGGITEETTVMGVPCMTLRDNTERPETVSIGTNEIVGTNPEHIKKYLEKLLDGNWKSGTIPELWDGEAGKRIVDHLLTL